jgi:hypothetical protein
MPLPQVEQYAAPGRFLFPQSGQEDLEEALSTTLGAYEHFPGRRNSRPNLAGAAARPHNSMARETPGKRSTRQDAPRGAEGPCGAA